MSQQQQQYPSYPPRAFSPQQRTASPLTGSYPPPLPSPGSNPSNPTVPPSRPPGEYNKGTTQSVYPVDGTPQYGSAGPANITLPNQVFSSPYYGAQPNGGQPSHNYGSSTPYTPHSPHTPYTSQYSSTAFQAPPPIPSTPQHDMSIRGGAMGPPSRPSDKPTDINDLGDVLAGSGVDLREEEAAMFNNPTPYPLSRDNHYSPYAPSDRQSFYGAGFYNQASTPYRSPEALAAEERKQAIRRKAEIKQYHLNDPFLLPGTLRRKMVTEVNKNHIKFDDTGLFLPKEPPNPPQESTISGPDGHAVKVSLQSQGILSLDTALVEILSLLSLATEERMRMLVEDVATLARGRRVGALGIIPPDLDGRTAEGKSLDIAHALPTPGDSAVSPGSKPLKRSYSEMNDIFPSSSTSASLPVNPIVQVLQQTIKQDRHDEEKRLAKRAERKAKKSAASGEGSTLEGTGTPSALPEVAPIVDVKKPPKKGRAADNVSQAQQLNALNNTTQMALGGKKMPSWMSGASKGPSNPYLPRSNANTNVKKEGASSGNITANGSGGAGASGGGRGGGSRGALTFGEFREDKEDGKGIQLRDLILVLEQNAKGMEKRALQRAYGRQGKSLEAE